MKTWSDADARAFEQLLALNNQVCQQITFGWQPEQRRHDGTPEDILRLAQDGAKFVCGTFQRLMSSRVADAGFPVREVTVIRRGTEAVDPQNDFWGWFARHQVVEVNLRPVGEPPLWVMLDPTNNVHYIGPRPLSVADILTELYSGQRRVFPIYGSYLPARPVGPAWVNGEQVLTATQVDKIFDKLIWTDHLYYYGYALIRDPRWPAVRAFSGDSYRPTEHWNQPLETFVGSPIEWVERVRDLL